MWLLVCRLYWVDSSLLFEILLGISENLKFCEHKLNLECTLRQHASPRSLSHVALPFSRCSLSGLAVCVEDLHTMGLGIVCSLCLKCSSLRDPPAQTVNSSGLVQMSFSWWPHWLTLLHLSYILVPFSPHYLPLVTCFFIRFLFVSHDLLVSFWGQRFSSTSLPLNLQCHQCLVKLNEWLDGFLPCTPEGFILEGRHGWQSSKPINGLFISDEKVKQRYGIGVMKKRGTEDGCHRRLSDVWRHSVCLEQSEQ